MVNSNQDGFVRYQVLHCTKTAFPKVIKKVEITLNGQAISMSMRQSSLVLKYLNTKKKTIEEFIPMKRRVIQFSLLEWDTYLIIILHRIETLISYSFNTGIFQINKDSSLSNHFMFCSVYLNVNLLQ